MKNLSFAAVLILAAGSLAACATSIPQLRTQGGERMAVRDWAGALNKYDAVLAKAPDDVTANYGRGACLLSLGKPQQAETSLRRALGIAGRDNAMSDDICDRIAESKVAQKDLAGFIAFAGDEIKRQGTSRDHLRMARGLAAFGDADGAVASFRRAELSAWDETPEERYSVYLATADYYLSVRDQPNALRYTRYAAAINHKKPEIETRLTRLGRVPGPTEYVAGPTKAELLKPSPKSVIETK